MKSIFDYRDEINVPKKFIQKEPTLSTTLIEQEKISVLTWYANNNNIQFLFPLNAEKEFLNYINKHIFSVIFIGRVSRWHKRKERIFIKEKVVSDEENPFIVYAIPVLSSKESDSHPTPFFCSISYVYFQNKLVFPMDYFSVIKLLEEKNKIRKLFNNSITNRRKNERNFK